MHRAVALPGLSAREYQRHALHSAERTWVEKNCYVDVWIELLHALRIDPVPMLAFTVAVDFEGDQWTFFKPPHEDLRVLYGVDVQELYVWRPLIEHAAEHLSAGKFISTEADAFWLPDTAGTDYRQQHTKTTIILGELSIEERRLSYFHNAGYFSLEGEDFANLLRPDSAPDPTFMPLFAELIRVERMTHRPAEWLRAASLQLLCKHVERRCIANPMPGFRKRVDLDLPSLLEQGMRRYHAWVFGTLRQLGAASELSALHLRWLQAADAGRFDLAAAAFDDISTICKSLIMKIARAVTLRRPLDASASFDDLASAWERSSAGLRRAL